MKLVCNYGNLADEGSYWCRSCDRNCPPAQLSLVFDQGEQIDGWDVVERVRIFPTSSLYRVKRGKESAMLKLAHQGLEDELKLEAKLLAQLAEHSGFPALITVVGGDERLYRKTTIKEQARYYLLTEEVEGQSLRDLLNRQPQPQPDFAAQLTISLADAIAYLNVKARMLINGVNADAILVRVDKTGVPRPQIVDLSSARAIGQKPPQRRTVLSTMSPEQVQDHACDVQSDVYSLAALLYEMLAGQPVFKTRSQQDDELRAAILREPIVPIKQRRPELVTGVSDVIQQGLQRNPQQRQKDIRTFAKGLRTLFGEVPAEPKPVRIDRRTLAIVVLVILFVLVALLLVIMLVG
jgi:serine/threonine protein kinase